MMHAAVVRMTWHLAPAATAPPSCAAPPPPPQWQLLAENSCGLAWPGRAGQASLQRPSSCYDAGQSELPQTGPAVVPMRRPRLVYILKRFKR